MIPLHYQPSVDTVLEYADDAVRLMLQHYKIDISSYSLSSLELVDYVLNEWKKSGAPINQIGKSLYAFGAFTGEVLRMQIIGDWFKPTTEPDPDNFLNYPFLSIKLVDGRECHPINLAFEMMISENDVNFRGEIEKILTAHK